jgi:hypothetical protein
MFNNASELKALEQRLKKLESRNGSGKPCPVCGEGDDDGLTEYEVEFIFEDEEDEGGEEEEYCPHCGRQTTYTVTWDGM